MLMMMAVHGGEENQKKKDNDDNNRFVPVNFPLSSLRLYTPKTTFKHAKILISTKLMPRRKKNKKKYSTHL